MASIQARFDRSFVEQYRGSRGSSQSGESRFKAEDLQRSIEERRGRGRGRGRQDQVDPTAPVVSTQPVPNPTPPVQTSPTAPTPSTNPPQQSGTPPISTDGSVRSLAEKYVDVYAQQSGKSLSSATRDALVTDVASFYGENGSRTERLRSLVGVF